MSSELLELEEMVADLQNARDDTTSSELRAMLDDELLKAQNQLQQLTRVTAQLKERELLEKDLSLLKATLPQLSDEEIKASITAVIEKCQQRIAQLSGQPTKEDNTTNGEAVAGPATADKHVTLTNYAWDQSNKFIKLHVSVPGLHTSDSSKVSCSFTVAGLDLRIKNLNDKNYTFVVNNLAYNINPSNSKHTVKDGTVLLLLRKAATSQQWRAVNAVEDQKLKQKDTNAKNFEKDLKKTSGAYLTAISSKNAEAAQESMDLGYYSVGCHAEAVEMLKKMDTVPPKIVDLRRRDRHMDDMFKTILTRIANINCVVMVNVFVDFVLATSATPESLPAELLLGKTFKLGMFIGHLKAESIRKVPGTAEAAAVAAMPSRMEICVCISKHIHVKDLKLLPATLITSQDPAVASAAYQLYFPMADDEDATWIVQCINKLVGRRVFQLAFAASHLSWRGVLMLSAFLSGHNLWKMEIDTPFIKPSERPALAKKIMEVSNCRVVNWGVTDECVSLMPNPCA